MEAPRRLRGLLASPQTLDRSRIAQKVSLNQLETQSENDGKAWAGAEDGGNDNPSGVGTLTQDHTEMRSIQSREKTLSLLALTKMDLICVRSVCLAELRNNSMQDWKGIPRPPDVVRSNREVPSPDHARVATSSAPITSKLDDAAQIGLRVGFRGCRQRGKLRPLRWNPSGRHLFAGGGEVARASKPRGSEPKLGTPFLRHIV